MDILNVDLKGILSKLYGEFDDASSKKLKFIIATGLAVPVSYYVLETLWEIYVLRFRVGGVVDQLPGPPAKFLAGTLHEFPGSNEKGLAWYVNMSTLHKKMFRTWGGPLRPTVILVHPEPVKELLKTAEPKLGLANSGYRFTLPWLGRGLLISDGRRWARNRRLLTPAFHFDVLKPYVDIYNECGDKLVASLLQKRQTSESVEIFAPVSLATLQTVLKCAFSYSEDIQELGSGETHPYVNAVIQLAKSIIKRIYKPWLGVDWIYSWTEDGKKFKQLCNYVHNIADEVICKRQQALESDSSALEKRYLDFLDILLSARDSDGQGLSALEVRQEVDTFLFEGHDTTASAISWTLYSLAQHPDIQEKVRQEVRDVLNQKDNFDWDDLSKLPFLTQCIKEGMRLHSPVPSISRDLSQDMTIGGITFRRYTRMNVLIYAVHHNPHVWGADHMEYKPERFEPEKMKDMDSHTFIPFSAGPRNCIGQNFAMGEMKAIIGKVLNRFRLEDDKTHIPYKLSEFIMRSKNGIKIKLTPI